MKRIAALLVFLCAPVLAQNPAQTPPEAPRGPTLEQIARLFFHQYDANGDGTVTRREFLTPSMNQFDFLDRNGDGAVDMQEVTAFTQMMTQQQQRQPQ